MRRIDKLAGGGEIRVFPPDVRKRVEETVRSFWEEDDDTITRYLRYPSAEIKALTVAARRERMREEREAYLEQAQHALAAIIGQEQATFICESILRSTWAK
jgi:hypothetical protein